MSNEASPKGMEEVASIVVEDVKTTEAQSKVLDKKSTQEQASLFGTLTVSEQIDLQKTQMLVRDRQSERNLRRKHSDRSFRFSSIWAGFIGLLILLKGFSHCTTFNLTTTEFLAVIGALSGTILTYYMVILNYLFPRNRKKRKN